MTHSGGRLRFSFLCIRISDKHFEYQIKDPNGRVAKADGKVRETYGTSPMRVRGSTNVNVGISVGNLDGVVPKFYLLTEKIHLLLSHPISRSCCPWPNLL